MTEPVERPQASQDEGPPPEPRGEPFLLPVETQMAVQQLREAGFSEDQQAALTTALLRVLALWTQQATRGDLHAEQQALAQRAALLHTTRPEPPRWRDVLLWLSTALLGLTAVGVILLVVSRFVGP